MFRWLIPLAVLMTMQTASPDTTDPYLWLEDVTGDRALAWVKQQNAESTTELASTPEFAALDERLRSILDSQERIPLIEKRGDAVLQLLAGREEPARPVAAHHARRVPQAAPGVGDGARPRRARRRRERELGLARRRVARARLRARAAAALARRRRRGGRPRVRPRRRRRSSRTGSPCPRRRATCRGRIRDTLYVGTDFGPGTLTDSGYPRLTKEWRRGTPLTAASLVFEGQMTDVAVSAMHDPTPGFERDLVLRGVTFWESDVFLRRNGALVKIDKPRDAEASLHREWLLLRLRTAMGRRRASSTPRARCSACDLDAFLAGARTCDVLFAPTERTSLDAYAPTRISRPAERARQRAQPPPRADARAGGLDARRARRSAGVSASASVTAVDRDESDDYFAVVQDFLTPMTLSMGTAGRTPPEVLKRAPAFFDAEGLRVSQHEATSKDGTRVPYFQVSRQTLALDGTAPTLLYGYGGFEVSMTPGYNALVGRGVARARRRLRGRQHPRRRRVRARAGTRPRSRRTGSARTTTSSRSPRT